MYYLMSKKNKHGTYMVYAPRFVNERNKKEILHKFKTWDEVYEYMTNPLVWVKENLTNES